MGSAVSIQNLADYSTFEQCKDLAGSDFNENVFNNFKDSNGMVSKANIIELYRNYQNNKSRFSTITIDYPTTIDPTLFVPFHKYMNKDRKAYRNYEMWNDDTIHEVGTGLLITDPILIQYEKQQATKAIAKDAGGAGLPAARIKYAIRIDFLIAMTFSLNLWEWMTWEVVTFLIKPATEVGRLRFSEHPLVKPYTGHADALMSHAWSNKWGILMAAAAKGAPYNRYVWICALANRQWAGNIYDKDFKSMINLCKAMNVANPIPDLT